MLALLVSALVAVFITWIITTVVNNLLLVQKLKRILPNFNTVPAVPILGNTLEFRKNPTPPGIFATFAGFHTRYGENVITQSLLNQPGLQVTSGPVVEQVINTKTVKKSIIYEFMKPWLNEGLVTSLGKKWAQRRKIITPAFHFKILEEFLDIFNQRSEDFIGKLRSRVGKGDFNIYEDVTLCTLDIISESAMGVKINAQDNPDTPYINAVKEMSEIIFRRLFSMMREYKIFFQMNKAAQRQKAAVAVLHDFTDSVITTRKAQLESEQARKATRTRL